jgi:hypothetical protein
MYGNDGLKHLIFWNEGSIIYQKLSTQNFTSDFNGSRPFAQILLSQNSKGIYESKKILDFIKTKLEK